MLTYVRDYSFKINVCTSTKYSFKYSVKLIKTSNWASVGFALVRVPRQIQQILFHRTYQLIKTKQKLMSFFKGDILPHFLT